jgi:hypothetical protein
VAAEGIPIEAGSVDSDGGSMGDTDEAESVRMIHTALDAGIDLGVR